MYARSRAGPARDRTHRPSPTAARGHWVRDTLSLSRLWSQRFRQASLCSNAQTAHTSNRHVHARRPRWAARTLTEKPKERSEAGYSCKNLCRMF